ncbi:hypothetical protein GE09DRAFT_980439 [Coniochaeta sp. 2T2.1]|nr:hypothetical protein GE09DRAFT_980439 [Coniochaeta sp. 2T2.1]
MDYENLYIVKRTTVDPNSPAEPAFNTAIPAVFTNLVPAKVEARATLFNEGYERDDFTIYDVNTGQETWCHGDGVIVYAEALSGQVFKVEVETITNTSRLEPDDDARIRRPLHHVLQTIVHYNEDRSGSIRDSIIEGTYVSRDAAEAHAFRVLLDNRTNKDDFIQYNEYPQVSDRPFGADILVHAVKEGGENILVSVISSYVI